MNLKKISKRKREALKELLDAQEMLMLQHGSDIATIRMERAVVKISKVLINA